MLIKIEEKIYIHREHLPFYTSTKFIISSTVLSLYVKRCHDNKLSIETITGANDMILQCILRAFRSHFRFIHSKRPGLLISRLKSVRIVGCYCSRKEIFSTKYECFNAFSSKCIEIESNPRNSNNFQLSLILTFILISSFEFRLSCKLNEDFLRKTV